VKDTVPQPIWLQAARNGDVQAFDRLVRPLLGSLMALARRLARPPARPEELLQESLIRAHRGLAEFAGACTFRSWIVGILWRLASQPERLAPRPLPAADIVDLADAIPDRIDNDPLNRVSARDLLDRVEEAMERLPPRQRTALHLRAVEGWDYDEIARALDTSPGAARMAVLAARQRLRQRLGEVLE
jgi:RNA polymerase sigma-70 factor (ECF subfamily)